jgi:hypothetical protein
VTTRPRHAFARAVPGDSAWQDGLRASMRAHPSTEQAANAATSPSEDAK